MLHIKKRNYVLRKQSESLIYRQGVLANSTLVTLHLKLILETASTWQPPEATVTKMFAEHNKSDKC